MTFELHCQHCNEKLEVPDDYSGTIKCKCGKTIDIPKASTKQTEIITENSIPAIENETHILSSEDNTIAYSTSTVNSNMSENFGHYKVISELGRGGMGIVYKAKDTKLNRTVAIKVMLSGDDVSDDQIKRFHREAESVAKLNHPNIVPIHEVDQIDGKHYFTMDYIEGTPLDLLINEKKLKTKQSIELMQKIASTLDFCHNKGVIHRDMKPANIIVDSNGKPHIMDFGLAKLTHIENTKITRTGSIMGTPAYLSPEQAESSSDIDHRADIWSMGVMLYEMISGETPFQGENAMEIITKICFDEALPIAKKIPIQQDINTITMKCLEKDKSDRYSNAKELAEDLQRYLNDEPILATPPSTLKLIAKKINKNKLAAILVILLCAICLTSYLVIQKVSKQSQNTSKMAEKKIAEIKKGAQKEVETAKVKAKEDALADTIQKINNLASEVSTETLTLTKEQKTLLEGYSQLEGVKEYFKSLLNSESIDFNENKDDEERLILLAVASLYDDKNDGNHNIIGNTLINKTFSESLRSKIFDYIKDQEYSTKYLMELSRTQIMSQEFRSRLFFAIGSFDNGGDLLNQLKTEIPESSFNEWRSALQEYNNKEHAKLFIEKLYDKNFEERSKALSFIQYSKIKMAYENIFDIMLKDKDVKFRNNASIVMAQIATKELPSSWIMKFIKHYKEFSPDQVRTQAAWAIYHLADKENLPKEAVPLILELLEHEKFEAAIDVLSSILTKLARNNLLTNEYYDYMTEKLTNESKKQIRINILSALREVANKEKLPEQFMPIFFNMIKKENNVKEIAQIYSAIIQDDKFPMDALPYLNKAFESPYNRRYIFPVFKQLIERKQCPQESFLALSKTLNEKEVGQDHREISKLFLSCSQETILPEFMVTQLLVVLDKFNYSGNREIHRFKYDILNDIKMSLINMITNGKCTPQEFQTLLKLMKKQKEKMIRLTIANIISKLTIEKKIESTYIKDIIEALKIEKENNIKLILIKILENLAKQNENSENIVNSFIEIIENENNVISAAAACSICELNIRNHIQHVINELKDNESKDLIFPALEKISGEKFGADVNTCQKWWEENKFKFIKSNQNDNQ